MTVRDRVRSLQPEVLLRVSIGVAVATIVLKTLAWWLTGSVGLLSDAMESLVNLAGAGFALLMVRIAVRPADAEHPYGHTKAEYFSSAFEGLLILLAALAIAWTALPRFADPRPLEQLGPGLALSLASTVLNGVLAWAMLQAARAHRSMALEADGRHLLTDVWTSVGVLVGVAGVAATGWLWLDPLVALAVAANIVWEGGRLVWRSSQGLMDRAVESDVQEEIDRTLAGFAQSPVRFDHVATRRSGRRRFVDLHMHVPGGWTLARAAALRGKVEQALMQAVPGLRASIQLLPTDVETHLDERKEED